MLLMFFYCYILFTREVAAYWDSIIDFFRTRMRLRIGASTSKSHYEFGFYHVMIKKIIDNFLFLLLLDF